MNTQHIEGVDALWRAKNAYCHRCGDPMVPERAITIIVPPRAKYGPPVAYHVHSWCAWKEDI